MDNFRSDGPSIHLAGTGAEKHGQARKLEAAIVLVVALSPLVLVFSRESSVAILALLAALSTASAAARRGIRPVFADLGAAATRWPILVLATALGYAAASVAWSVVPERGGMFALHMAGTAVGAVALFTFGRQLDSRRFIPVLCAGLLLASALVIFEMTNKLALRGMLGISTDYHQLNRVAIAIALLLPVLAFALLGKRTGLAFFCFAAVAAPSVYAVHIAISSTAHLVLLLVLLVIPACMLAPRAMHRLATFVIIAATITAPLYVGHINSLIPEAIHQRVAYGSMGIRGDMWAVFAQLFWERPFFGFGIETSSFIDRTPFSAALSDHELGLIMLGHTHNAILQVWIDLGLVGAIFMVILIAVGMHSVEGYVRPTRLPLVTGLAVAMYTVSFVSHGAWQAWWPCLAVIVAYAVVLVERASSSEPLAEDDS